jgi:tetratricopeptide (TPR) repeat protein
LDGLGPHVVSVRGAGAGVELAPDLQTEIQEKERSLGGDHFAVLGILPSASPEEIRAAYHAQSKRFHPDRFFKKELGPYRVKLERIFRRVNEANAVLSDPARRAAYLAENPKLTEAHAPEPVAPERLDERRSRLARHPYLVSASRTRDGLARAQRLIDSGELALALELLNGLLKVEPRNADALGLVAEARRRQHGRDAQTALRMAEQAEAEGRTAEALAAYQRVLEREPTSARAHFKVAALLLASGASPELARGHAKSAAELAPQEADHRALFAQVLVALGAKKLARKELEVALSLSPRHREANQLLKKVRWTLLGGSKP